MELNEVLSEDIIDLNLKGTTKDEILRELSQHLYDNGYISDVDQWESYDDQPVNLFFLFCVSDDEGFAQNHMRLLAKLAGKIGNDDLCEELQKAQTPAKVIEILTRD